MKEFFERHKGPKHGFCRLCGKNAKLTADHVPPKSCSNFGLYKIRHIQNSSWQLSARNGITFSTICSDCNNGLLGKFDVELAKLANHCKAYLHSIAMGLNFNQGYRVSIATKTIAQSVVGHILAAHDFPVKLGSPLQHRENQYLSDLHDIFEGKNIPEITIGLWLHNFPTINIFPSGSIGGPFAVKKDSLFSVLSFFPLGFMAVARRYSPNEIPFIRIRTDVDSMEIDLARLKRHSEKYPIDSLERDMVAVNTYHMYTAEKFPRFFNR